MNLTSAAATVFNKIKWNFVRMWSLQPLLNNNFLNKKVNTKPTKKIIGVNGVVLILFLCYNFITFPLSKNNNNVGYTVR